MFWILKQVFISLIIIMIIHYIIYYLRDLYTSPIVKFVEIEEVNLPKEDPQKENKETDELSNFLSSLV